MDSYANQASRSARRAAARQARDAVGFKIRLHERQQGARLAFLQFQHSRVGQGGVQVPHGPVARRDPRPSLVAACLQVGCRILGGPRHQAIRGFKRGQTQCAGQRALVRWRKRFCILAVGFDQAHALQQLAESLQGARRQGFQGG